MHKGVKFSGAVIYSFAVAYGLWTGFRYLIPLAMSHRWLIIASYFLTGVFIIGLLNCLGNLLFRPFSYFIVSPLFKVIPFIALLISGTNSLTTPWEFISSHTFTSYLTVIIADTFILAVYGTLFRNLLRLPVPRHPDS